MGAGRAVLQANRGGLGAAGAVRGCAGNDAAVDEAMLPAGGTAIDGRTLLGSPGPELEPEVPTPEN